MYLESDPILSSWHRQRIRVRPLIQSSQWPFSSPSTAFPLDQSKSRSSKAGRGQHVPPYLSGNYCRSHTPAPAVRCSLIGLRCQIRNEVKIVRQRISQPLETVHLNSNRDPQVALLL